RLAHQGDHALDDAGPVLGPRDRAQLRGGDGDDSAHGFLAPESATPSLHQPPFSTSPRATRRRSPTINSPSTSRYSVGALTTSKMLASPAAPVLSVPRALRRIARAAFTVVQATISGSAMPSARNFPMVYSRSNAGPL